MGCRSRILKAAAPMPEGCGPATKAVLRGIARAHGFADRFEGIFRGLLDSGELVISGGRKCAVYGLPRRRA